MNKKSPNLNKFSNVDQNYIERNVKPSSIARNDNSSNESSNVSTSLETLSLPSISENNKTNKYDHNWKKIQSDNSHNFLSKDICQDLKKTNRSTHPT